MACGEFTIMSVDEKVMLELADEFKGKSERAQQQLQRLGTSSRMSDDQIRTLINERDNFLYAATRILEVLRGRKKN